MGIFKKLRFYVGVKSKHDFELPLPLAQLKQVNQLTEEQSFFNIDLQTSSKLYTLGQIE